MELRKRDRIRLPGRYTSDQLYGDVDFITAPRDSGVNASAKHRTSAQPVHDDSPPNEPNPSGISSSRLAHLRSRALNMRCTNDDFFISLPETDESRLHPTLEKLLSTQIAQQQPNDKRAGQILQDTLGLRQEASLDVKWDGRPILMADMSESEEDEEEVAPANDFTNLHPTIQACIIFSIEDEAAVPLEASGADRLLGCPNSYFVSLREHQEAEYKNQLDKVSSQDILAARAYLEEQGLPERWLEGVWDGEKLEEWVEWVERWALENGREDVVTWG